MIRIVFLNGVGGTGKNTLSETVQQIVRPDDVLVSHISTVDTVKSICESIGIPKEPKTDEKRALWNEFKSAWIKFNNGPFNETNERIDHLLLAYQQHIIFVDVREPAELRKFKNHYGDRCRTVLFKRDGIHIPDNPADRSVTRFDYDLILENNGGLEDISIPAKRLVNYLMSVEVAE